MVKYVVSWVSVRSLSQSWEVGYRVGAEENNGFGQQRICDRRREVGYRLFAPIHSCLNASNRFSPTKIRCCLNPLLCFMYPLDYSLLSLCYNALHSETLPIPIDT